jgi:hypothetical protein
LEEQIGCGIHTTGLPRTPPRQGHRGRGARTQGPVLGPDPAHRTSAAGRARQCQAPPAGRRRRQRRRRRHAPSSELPGSCACAHVLTLGRRAVQAGSGRCWWRPRRGARTWWSCSWVSMPRSTHAMTYVRIHSPSLFCMHMYVVCRSVCIYTYIRVCTIVFLNVCLCIHVCLYMYVYVCVCVRVCACMCVCMCVRHIYLYLDMYTRYICKYIHIYIFIQYCTRMRVYDLGHYVYAGCCG